MGSPKFNFRIRRNYRCGRFFGRFPSSFTSYFSYYSFFSSSTYSSSFSSTPPSLPLPPPPPFLFSFFFSKYKEIHFGSYAISIRGRYFFVSQCREVWWDNIKGTSIFG
uniref:Uncharacterized protein n=1 Tax=Cacopsylla melanoneura TaxID=428564 RepID=A0A8D8V7T4_9HEMI